MATDKEGGVSDYDGPVRRYLADCRKAAAELEAAGSFLDPKYHPTADGACKLIAHRGVPAEAAKIREAFRSVQASMPGGAA